VHPGPGQSPLLALAAMGRSATVHARGRRSPAGAASVSSKHRRSYGGHGSISARSLGPLTPASVTRLQRQAGNRALSRVLAAPAPAVPLVVQRDEPTHPSTGSYDDEQTFVRYAIGAHELDKLAAGVTLHRAHGQSVMGLSEKSFAVGPFTTDMGRYFYVYRFTSTDRSASSYSLSRGMSPLGWDVEKLKESFGSVTGTKTIAVNATGLAPGGGGAPVPAGGAGSGAGGTRTGGDTTGDTTTAAPPPEEVPAHRRKWVQAGREAMAREVVSKLDSIQELKDKRIDNWKSNAKIEDAKPLRTALELAISIASAGMGGVVGKLISGPIASALMQEFVKSAGKAGTQELARRTVGAAVSKAKAYASTTASSDKLQESAQAALVSKGDLVDCYSEAQSLTASADEAAEVTAFNQDEKGLSLEELADQVQVVTELYGHLLRDPADYMRLLTIGLFKVQDETYLDKEAEDYGGSREELYAKSGSIDETGTRSGNMRIMGPLGGIGKYYAPDYPADFGGHVTGINKATLANLDGTPLQDLPFSLAFRFWATNPFSGLFQDVFCKVWFVRRPDGTIVVDFNDADDDNGLEWLASYYLGTSRELSSTEQREYSAKGATKVWNDIKGKKLRGAMNTDLF
jgi:hypothetical protein